MDIYRCVERSTTFRGHKTGTVHCWCQKTLKNKKYKDCSEKIRNLTLSYNTNDNINYLKGIAYNITLQM